MNKRKNMALTLKFVYVMIIFISLFLIVTNSSKLFPTIFKLSSLFFHIVSSYFSIIYVFLFNIAAQFPSAQFPCNDDDDCTRDMCMRNSLTPKCIKYTCECM